MADQCIVCLEDLDVVPDAIRGDLRDAGSEVAAVPTSDIATPHPGKFDNDQAIALIKPCGHVLHDECLREWSQKANSCPICRHQFNLVEVLDKVGGTVLSEYAVQDKRQVAEFDPNAWIEEDDEEEEEATPCLICGEGNDEDVLLLCDSCAAPYHTYCIDLDQVPHGHWYCMECSTSFMDDRALTRALELDSQHGNNRTAAGRSHPRTQASVRETRRRGRTDRWVGAWGAFSNGIHHATGLDLDFSDDDSNMASWRTHSHRTAEEQREFQRWQQRLNIASRQGAGHVFLQAAPSLRDPTPAEPPEVAQAWNALEKAKEVPVESPRSRKRKSRSVTASPADRSEMPQEPERKLKRPRTRRILDAPGPSSSVATTVATSSRSNNGSSRRESPLARPMQDTVGEPSFLAQLLKEVETTTSDDDAPRSIATMNISIPNRVASPLDLSSPATSPSPTSSAYHSSPAMSTTPPPHISKRSGSPLPLSSRIEPIYPPADYMGRSASHTPKPNREKSNSPTIELRQPRPRRQMRTALPRSEDTSPVRASMSAEAKDGISKIVKVALQPHWKAAEITKEQYADINREISRKLYEIVADRSIEDEKNKCRLEKMASTEVALAVKSLTA